MRSLCLLMPLMVLAALFGCDTNFNGYDEDHPSEDWKYYDYVFQGASPDPEGLEMVVEFNLTDETDVGGRVYSIFYADFTGTLDENGKLELTMTFSDPRCEDPGYAEFTGWIVEDILSGRWLVDACVRSEFDYEGELVGGRFYE